MRKEICEKCRQNPEKCKAINGECGCGNDGSSGFEGVLLDGDLVIDIAEAAIETVSSIGDGIGDTAGGVAEAAGEILTGIFD